MHGRAMLRSQRSRQSAEIGKRGNRQVNLDRSSFAPVLVNLIEELGVEMALVNQAQKSSFRIKIARNQWRIELLAGAQHYSTRPSIFDLDRLDLGICPDLRPSSFGRGRNRIGDRSHAAAYKTPQTSVTRHSAHAMMQQDVCRARRAWPSVRTDYAVRGQRNFDLFVLEPLIQKLCSALRKDFY